MELGLSKILTTTFEETITKVTDELKKEGFGIITTIDFKNTVKEKLNKDFRKFTILGACNPQFAYDAVLIDDKIGLLLPCNVMVQEKEGKTEVSIFNPALLTFFVTDEKLTKMSEELVERIKRILSNL